jgi:hypothetical protein
MTDREQAFRKGFHVIRFGEALERLISNEEIWSCRYAEDTLTDEDGQPSFTTISKADVEDYTLSEIEALGPFAK